ncbi:hypothetical protein DERF_014939 [Dermatophagoides farinae]|uniref:Uncharacterized protein n=1 Tax=Dermatophagoides farinae TaxID=6954 RepID=A0A922HN80_DERFA|nr:hypothetical protein DERF_014939 [Dermatophagoides farinae]
MFQYEMDEHCRIQKNFQNTFERSNKAIKPRKPSVVHRAKAKYSSFKIFINRMNVDHIVKYSGIIT